MRILVHDFVGHPFQLDLSRELAKRGHRVLHVHAEGFPGPKGELASTEQSNSDIRVIGIELSSRFGKYAPLRRFSAQRAYVRELRQLIDVENPEVMISDNTPIDVQLQLLRHCRTRGTRFVHWIQDVYCQAIEFFLKRKIGALASLATIPFRQVEKYVARESDAVVVICDAFAELLRRWHVVPKDISVIENWSRIEPVVTPDERRRWRERHGVNDKIVFLYSGTMGIKHRPDLMYLLAERLDDRCAVVVVSEGLGRDYLDRMPRRDNLITMDFQDYRELPTVLSSADVLVATLEAGAGEFAVPSKIMTYLSVGRPILLSAPLSNLAATTVSRSKAGFVVNPSDSDAWVTTGIRLAEDASLRDELGHAGRRYAERCFDIRRIGDAFEAVLVH